MKRILLFFYLLVPACASDVLRLHFPSRFPKNTEAQCRRVEKLFNQLFVDRGLPDPFNTMHLAVSVVPIDGRWNIFAQSLGGTWRQNVNGLFVMDGAGRIELDSADVPFWTDETLTEVVTHEVSHFFGFVTPIWHANGLLTDGEYTGPAMFTYQAERDPFATFIPMGESHFAQSLAPWLMTPALTGSWISPTMLQVIEDNGTSRSPFGQKFQGGPLAAILPHP